MAVDQIVEGVWLREGDFVDNSDGPEGATRWGITERTARKHGYEGLMDALSRGVVREDYLEKYYFMSSFETVGMSPKLSEELTDTGVSISPRKAVTPLQYVSNSFSRRGSEFPNLVVDGQLGAKCLSALKSYRWLGKCKNFFETFMYGWIRPRGI